MIVREATSETLAALAAAEWFCKVGVNDTREVKSVGSWPEALEWCLAPAWDDLCHEATNEYCSRVAERSRARFREWNSAVRELKGVVDPLLLEKTSAVIGDNDLPDGFRADVFRDVLFVALEAEFSDVYAPGFFASQAYWYLNGHFPCGWEGVFPQGRLVIF